jgi:spore maturation protein CgeB
VRIVYFTHSLLSCCNHGNAHFLRGVLRELSERHHAVAAFEPKGGWSLTNLLASHGEASLAAFRSAYPEIAPRTYETRSDVEAAIETADLVIVHEWTEPWVVAAIGQARRKDGRFTLLFHDTHHRAVSDPATMKAYELESYDGVLAFGETLAEVYRGWGWGERAFVWHEAADARLFRPPAEPVERHGLVWIGNWGDGERSAELRHFLLGPARWAGLPLDIYGVRYPEAALQLLAETGAAYHGWLANTAVPQVFARHLATVHVPRRLYVDRLRGIPTIRVFEALACGIPLISSLWHDDEGLFSPGVDFLLARTETEMIRHLVAVRHDADLRRALARHGRATIEARHSCAHRADELLSIVARLAAPPRTEAAA